MKMRRFDVAALAVALILCAQTEAQEIGQDEDLGHGGRDAFLETETASLLPGGYRMRFSLIHTLDQQGGLIEQDRQSAQASVEATAGFPIGEAFLVVPALWYEASTDVAGSNVADQDEAGLGNIVIGGRKTLKARDDDSLLNWTGTLAAQLPTGSTDRSSDNAAITARLNLDLNIDPAFLFGGIEGTKEIDGSDQDNISLTAGIGFSINHRLSLGLSVTETMLLNSPQGASRNQAFLENRATYAFDPIRSITVGVRNGLTESGADTAFSLSYSTLF